MRLSTPYNHAGDAYTTRSGLNNSGSGREEAKAKWRPLNTIMSGSTFTERSHSRGVVHCRCAGGPDKRRRFSRRMADAFSDT